MGEHGCSYLAINRLPSLCCVACDLCIAHTILVYSFVDEINKVESDSCKSLVCLLVFVLCLRRGNCENLFV